MKLLIVAAIALLVSSSEVYAQQDTPRFEIGGQFSMLSRNRPSTQFDDGFKFDDFDEFFPQRVNRPGFGGRFTYNHTKHIAFETMARI